MRRVTFWTLAAAISDAAFVFGPAAHAADVVMVSGMGAKCLDAEGEQMKDTGSAISARFFGDGTVRRIKRGTKVSSSPRHVCRAQFACSRATKSISNRRPGQASSRKAAATSWRKAAATSWRKAEAT